MTVALLTWDGDVGLKQTFVISTLSLIAIMKKKCKQKHMKKKKKRTDIKYKNFMNILKINEKVKKHSHKITMASSSCKANVSPAF